VAWRTDAADDDPDEPGASDESDVVEVGPSRQSLLAWRRWRRTRPFWGGLLIIFGGAEMLLSEQAPLPIVIHVGLQGLAGYLVPIVLVLCGLLLWLSPVQQTFYSVLAVVLSLASWITSNLGGFFVGLMLGVIGGALAFAWTRGDEPVPPLPPRSGPPRTTPSEGLSLILGDETADAEYQDAERPEREPSEDVDDGEASSGGGRAGSALLAVAAAPLRKARARSVHRDAPSILQPPSVPCSARAFRADRRAS
jgi:hypothetical protein